MNKMKQEFSKSWTGSKQPRKQIKFRANAPLHLRRKMISVSLSKELKKKHDKRNFPVKKGDSVSIMRGEFKGKSGKIENVDLKKMKVEIDGIYRTKKDGSKTNVYFEPSNLQIKEMDLTDKKRKAALERKSSTKSKKNAEKPAKETKEKSKVKETKKNA
jgi:large subunit ribosomal protein L24